MHMAMGSFTSLHDWYQLPWLKTFIFLHLLIQCFGSQISYSDHCASIVPESTRTAPEFASLPFRPIQIGYYNGGDRILNPNPSKYSSNYNNILLFETHHVHKTDVEGVFNIEANLKLYSLNSNFFGYGRTYNHSVFSPLRIGDDSALSFRLKGFWSKPSGKLCMVGSSSSYSPEGDLLHHPAVITLNGVKNSSTITSLVTGTVESLSSADDPSHFEPISLLIFPDTNYQYKVSEEFENECSGHIDVPAENSSLRLQVSTTICSILARPLNEFELEYASDCNSTKNCNPFADSVGYLPRIMSLKKIHCSPEGQRLRFLVEFPNSSYVGFYRNFNENTTFVAEGSWDWKKNRLCFVACRISNRNGSLDNSHVEDCSIRMTLRFPAIWSIRQTTSILGQIWSNKAVNNSGFFKRLVFRSTDYDNMLRVPGLKYEYTAIEQVRNMSCLKKKPVGKSLGKYPDGYSNEMSFDMSVKKSGGEIAWGYLDPISVGDHISRLTHSSMSWSSSGMANSSVEANTNNSRPLNISYRITLSPHYFAKMDGVKNLFNISSGGNRRVEIFAEGIYDAQTGSLCMVGCRRVGLKYHILSNDSMDCEILVHLQFPPLDAKKDGAFIRGSIVSSRNKSDPLYFDPLFISSTAFYTIVERQSIWRMDLEILMVLISNTLACVFVGFQILYVKKHPDVLPFISLFMLVILTLGHMMLLVLNFEALFFRSHNRQTLLLGSGGWLEVHEVIVRVFTMVAFLLQFRLLQLSLFKRLEDVNTRKSLWVAEKKALFLSSPLYLAGALITLFANCWNNKIGTITQSFQFNNQQHSLWGELRSYAGLILDSFLFPQILLNIFHNSREKALSRVFYIGFTIVRLAPHAYDIYRAHNYVQNFDGSFIYADPAADFYFTAWDVTIPFVALLFASIIYFQQRFGGRCFLPRRFRELEVYEKIPEASKE